MMQKIGTYEIEDDGGRRGKTGVVTVWESEMTEFAGQIDAQVNWSDGTVQRLTIPRGVVDVIRKTGGTVGRT